MNDSKNLTSLPDHKGKYYDSVLLDLHQALMPKTYLEIGVFKGDTLRLARCFSIAIDPDFKLEAGDAIKEITDKPALYLFKEASDEFFKMHSPSALFGRPVEMAFLDGMHRCEYLLRDFLNVERHCRRNSVVALHDCLPLERPMAGREQSEVKSIAEHRKAWWTGDVWRTALLLRRRRPDLVLTVLDAQPTGLILVTNLDPKSTMLDDDYAECVREMMSWDLDAIGMQEFFDEMHVESAGILATHEGITSRFWL